MELYDKTIEQACISSAMLSKEALSKIVDQVSVEDFYFQEHCEIYRTILQLYQKNNKIDMVSLPDQLKQNGQFEKIGGIKGLIEINRSVSTSANVAYYITRLQDLSKRRKLATLSTKIKDCTKDKDKQINDIFRDIETDVKLIDRDIGQEILAISEIMGKDITHLQLKEGEYITTGFDKFDHLIHGLFDTELIILAARPGQGKTSLALNIARNVAEKNKVMFFSLEMPARDLGLRLVASECNIDLNKIRLGDVDMYQLAEIKKAYKVIKRLDLHIDDRSGLNVENIINAVRRSAEYKKPRLVIIDYVSLVIATDKREQRYQQVAHTTRSFKQLAKEMKIPIMVLAQLGRNVENRAGQIPRLSDLRESGDIESDSDKVVFIYQEDENKSDVQLLVAKNRNGARGRIYMSFDKQYTKFVG